MTMIDFKDITTHYPHFKCGRLKDRFFRHSLIEELLNELGHAFRVTKIGESVEKRDIYSVVWGTGELKIFLWSQMHGDEATGTMALFDLLNLLKSGIAGIDEIAQLCQIHCIPMANPDGAQRFTRRNAQQIDINRDYLQLSSPEAAILKSYRDQLKPHFGFNLHDQDTLWSVQGSKKPATLSFLSPAFNEQLEINETRQRAMQVIADIFDRLDHLVPGGIGLFDDSFEARAFGDNFQKAGTSTILIEAGGYPGDDEKQHIRELYFLAIWAGICSMITRTYEKQDIARYFNIPENKKEIFHLLFRDIKLNDGVKTGLGLNYEEKYLPEQNCMEKIYRVEDIGDLRLRDAYRVFDSSGLTAKGSIILNGEANFDVISNGKKILSFRQGILL